MKSNQKLADAKILLDNNKESMVTNGKTAEYSFIVNKDLELKEPVKPTLIRVEDPNIAFSLLLDHFNNQNISKKGIDPNSSIHNSVNYGENLFFGNQNCFL